MKQIIVNTAIGHYALALRSKLSLVRAALFNPANIGMLANDYLGGILVTRFNRTGRTFVDIGAHIGSVISEVYLYNKDIKLIAVEAVPEKAQKLRSKFKGATVHSCAVGSTEGTVSFWINNKKSGLSSLIPPKESQTHITEIKVPVRKLDDLIFEDDIDVIKIDVEGSELEVLLGGKKVIDLNRPLIYFESGAPENEQRLKDIWNEFDELNYRILTPNRLAHNDDEGLSLVGFLESHLYPRRSNNYFAVPVEKRIATRDRAREILGVKPRQFKDEM